MGTYFFHEDTSDANDGAMKIVRYYYDDISEEILTRSFRLLPRAVQKQFLGNHLIPADLPADVKAKLKDFLYARMHEERRQAS